MTKGGARVKIMNRKALTWRQRGRRYGALLLAFLVLCTITVAVIGFSPRDTIHAATGDWTTYLGGDARTGYNAAETTINPSMAASLKVRWTAQGGAEISSEPVVVNGLVYWGDWSGTERATNTSTGQQVWSANLGAKPGPCTPTYGVTGSATFASVSINGTTTPVVFVSGGTLTVYALNAN